MQNDSAKEELSRYNLVNELARMHTEFTKSQAWTRRFRRILLISLGLFFPLLVVYIYLSDFSIPVERIDTLSVEVPILLLPLILLFLLFGGITVIFSKRISQLEELATQIEDKVEGLHDKTQSL